VLPVRTRVINPLNQRPLPRAAAITGQPCTNGRSGGPAAVGTSAISGADAIAATAAAAAASADGAGGFVLLLSLLSPFNASERFLRATRASSPIPPLMVSPSPLLVFFESPLLVFEAFAATAAASEELEFIWSLVAEGGA